MITTVKHTYPYHTELSTVPTQYGRVVPVLVLAPNYYEGDNQRALELLEDSENLIKEAEQEKSEELDHRLVIQFTPIGWCSSMYIDQL